MKKLIAFIIVLGLFATFAATTINLTTDVRGLLPVANGGTGTASPSIVAGSNMTVAGSWPNQTVTYKGAVDTSQWLPVDNVKDLGDMCRFASSIGIADGLLTLTINDAGPYSCAGYTGVGYSAPMIVSDPFYFQYGVVKARIRFGQPGNTLRSALWMWGGGSSSSGYPPTCLNAIANASTTGQKLMALCTTTSVTSQEIDIAECLSSNTSVHQNHIQWQNNAMISDSQHSASVANVDSQFHVYELDWSSTSLVFKVDGVTTNTISDAVTVPMFLIIDQESYNLPTSFPNTTSVDWVNVCSDPTATCDFGDSTTIFSDQFN